MRQAKVPLGCIGMAALVLVLGLNGCGAATTARAAATSTPTAAATAVPSPTATLTAADLPQSPGCQALETPTPPQSITVGGLLVSIPQRVLDYPSELMPTNEPKVPYRIAANAVNDYAPTPPVNPSLTPGYLFQFCNETSAALALSMITVNIDSFIPSSGPVTVWRLCQGGPYDAATKQTSEGCGGGASGPNLVATFQSDRPGASAPVTGLGWPVVVAPNTSVVMTIGANGLASQGTYALSFGVSVGGAAPAAVMPSDGPFLIAPHVAVWTGTACQSSAMQALIPPSSQDAYFVCPPSS
jgi:hypothetical protein